MLITKAVNDFFGRSEGNKAKVINFFLKRNKPELSGTEKEAVWYIKANLADPCYKKALAE